MTSWSDTIRDAPQDPDDETTATHRLNDTTTWRLLTAPSPAEPLPAPPRRRAVGTLERRHGPAMLGGYHVTGMLASGSMGVVYRGVAPSGQPVAIKAMHDELTRSPAVVARFVGEATATARIDHRNVVRCFDFGINPSGSPYLVMELLEGETLRSRLARGGRLDVATALDIAIQIGLGLAAAHRQGVIHRDLKPDNIFLAVDPAAPGSLLVKLLDFGVAKVAGHDPMHTQPGDLLGTPAYMAPEQGRAAAGSDARSDLYSVGCILYEMVCGRVPFSGSLVETLVAHQDAERPTAQAFNPEVPGALERLIGRLIARDPADRPATSVEMVSALRAIQDDPTGHGASMPRPVRLSTESIAGRSLWLVVGSSGRRARPWWQAPPALGLVLRRAVALLVRLFRRGADSEPRAGATAPPR